MTFEEFLKETMLANERGPVIDLMRHAWNAGKFHAKPRLRTIDQAEKDGTPVLIWENGEPLIVRYLKYNGLSAWRDWDMEPHNPTHCMLLPEPRSGENSDDL